MPAPTQKQVSWNHALGLIGIVANGHHSASAGRAQPPYGPASLPEGASEWRASSTANWAIAFPDGFSSVAAAGESVVALARSVDPSASTREAPLARRDQTWPVPVWSVS
jgi:hypothetical protein